MSIQHLTYCAQEIVNAAEFLKIKNADYFKRSIARIIAIRNDDFIKIGFKVNKASLNSQHIKDELNALMQFYTNYFKLQRDKYGAHFQDLNLTARLETWSNIDLERADFFSTMPVAVYSLFESVPGFGDVIPPDLSSQKIGIEELNDEFNLEKYPNFASDILSLTRRNSGGIIHFSGLQTKAGVLKSLELLIDYELAGYKKFNDHPQIRDLFAKLFIADLVSYADNFITRIDILTTAIQYENALDHFIDPSSMGRHHEIMNCFKANYKFEELRAELRVIRNKIAGHIDTSIPLTEMESMIQNFDLEKFEALYHQIKNTFRKMCHTEMILKTFVFDPYEKIHGVAKMIGLETKPFDGNAIVENEVTNLDVNDEVEYENQLSFWIQSNDNNARNFFWDACGSSEIKDKHSEAYFTDGQSRWLHYEIRKVHVFLKGKLANPLVRLEDKSSIIELFISLESGYPNALAEILIETFPNDILLRRLYIKAIGKLISNPTIIVFERLEDLLASNDFFDQYEVLLALFRIDVKSRFDSLGQHLKGETRCLSILKKGLNVKRASWINLVYSFALCGEYIFGTKYSRPTYKESHYIVFGKKAIASLREVILPLVRNEMDKRSLRDMERVFHQNRFITCLAMIGDFLEKHRHKVTARRIYTILHDQYIEFSKSDPIELRNYAVVSMRSNDLNRAIEIAKFLIRDYSYTYEYYYLLLSFYLNDKKYKEDFIKEKKYVLANFNLTNKEAKQLQKLQYTEA